MESRTAKPAYPANVPQKPSLFKSLVFVVLNCTLISVIALLLLCAWFGASSMLNHHSEIIYKIQQINTLETDYLSNLGISLVSYDVWFNRLLSLNSNSHTVSALHVLSILIELVFKRIIIFIAFIPCAAIIMTLMITEGLVQRDIRKFTGARESALYFHRLKPLTIWIFYLSFFLYLVCPYPITPMLFLIPMISMTSLLTMLTIKYFKKYV
jgi:hypothetical protein